MLKAYVVEAADYGTAQLAQWLGYWLHDLGFNSRQEQKIFSYPKRPDQLWGPATLLLIGYQGLLSRG
jgi:hypothetical protein